MKYNNFKLLVAALAIMMMSCGANAATQGRIIPNGSVSLEKNGTVSNYTEQTAVDEDALIACNGNCMVKLQGLSIVAADKTRFAVREINDSIHLYVETGHINFVVTDTSKPFSFYTPDGQYIKSEGYITPASTDKAVKGYFNISDKIHEIGMEQGSMIVLTENGHQTIKPGESMQLALANVPGGGTTASGSKKGAAAWWSTLSTPQQAGVVGLGIGAGVAAAIIIDNSTGSSNAGSVNQ